jgi:3-oxoacyl-[acyl-carrier protein] reductase
MTRNALELDGTVAIVTGSARNIGRAIALELAGAGAAVVINAKTSKREAEAVAKEITDEGGRAMAHLADVTRPEAVRAMVAAAVERFGRLDLLVNNAALRRDAPVTEIGYEDWREVVASILDAAFLCSQASVPHLAQHGRGAIVSIGGVAGHAGVAGRAHVVAAKAGVAGLTKGLAAELAPHGITANCVVPGYIRTERAHIPPHFQERPVLLGRPGTPEEVAGAVRYLCGPSARFITGQTIHLNGGWYMP